MFIIIHFFLRCEEFINISQSYLPIFVFDKVICLKISNIILSCLRFEEFFHWSACMHGWKRSMFLRRKAISMQALRAATRKITIPAKSKSATKDIIDKMMMVFVINNKISVFKPLKLKRQLGYKGAGLPQASKSAQLTSKMKSSLTVVY